MLKIELTEVDRHVEVWERAGYMSSAEAPTRCERIAVWRRFRVGRRVQRLRSVADIPLLDDPDPFLP